MNIEELNKTQIILLTLLVSFVTSIATGIVTVSLVNQAPPVVTDTIHKVIEKTVERVVPGEQKATIIENTVIVSEEDFIMDAIENNSQSLVRVYERIDEEISFVSLALVLSESGDIIADKNDFLIEEPTKDKEYFIYHQDEEVLVNKEETKLKDNFVLLKAQLSNNKDISFNPVTMGDSDNLKLGQSVVALGGEKSDVVLTGIISNLVRDKVLIKDEEGSDKEPDFKIITTQIDTNIDSQMIMKLLINLDGEVIGIKSESNFFNPINLIKEDIKNILQITEKSE
ncbi:MAG: hypothetical protein KAR54_03105 [Candidatus Pacebacteria bacterium]|nr:hypothetical protein [Candidatus Paceibacterota bacterium]